MIFQDLVSGRRMLIYIFPGHIQAGEKTPKETELPATHKLDIDLLWLISWCYFGSNLFLFLFFFSEKIGQHSISIDADLTVPIVWSQSHTIAKQKGNQPIVWSNHFIQTKPNLRITQPNSTYALLNSSNQLESHILRR